MMFFKIINLLIDYGNWKNTPIVSYSWYCLSNSDWILCRFVLVRIHTPAVIELNRNNTILLCYMLTGWQEQNYWDLKSNEKYWQTSCKFNTFRFHWKHWNFHFFCSDTARTNIPSLKLFFTIFSTNVSSYTQYQEVCICYSPLYWVGDERSKEKRMKVI